MSNFESFLCACITLGIAAIAALAWVAVMGDHKFDRHSSASPKLGGPGGHEPAHDNPGLRPERPPILSAKPEKTLLERAGYIEARKHLAHRKTAKKGARK